MRVGNLCARAKPGCLLRIDGLTGERARHVKHETLMIVESDKDSKVLRVRVPQEEGDGNGFDAGEVAATDVELVASLGNERRKFATCADYWAQRKAYEKGCIKSGNDRV